MLLCVVEFYSSRKRLRSWAVGIRHCSDLPKMLYLRLAMNRYAVSLNEVGTKLIPKYERGVNNQLGDRRLLIEIPR